MGFTATREGMTLQQKRSLLRVISVYRDSCESFHHGCCAGGDKQAHTMFKTAGVRTVGHPPKSKKLYANTPDDERWEPKSYGERDRDIADVCHLLVAAPKTTEPVKGSGTWLTAGIAVELKKPIIFIFPDGIIEYESELTRDRVRLGG